MKLTAFVLTLGAGVSHAFSPGFLRPALSSTSPTSAATRRNMLNLLTDESSITPEGYGFSTPTKRILKEAKRGVGYHRANGSDEVIDVMEAITLGVEDVALVFEEDKLLGIFTEADYVKVSIIPTADCCNLVVSFLTAFSFSLDPLVPYFIYVKFSAERSKACNEEESACYLFASVADYVTPVSDIIALSTKDTANIAIVTMQQVGVRHLIVADTVSAEKKLLPSSQVKGVINMQDVMSVIQKDERLSLNALTVKYPNIRNPIDQMREEMRSKANESARNPETAKRDYLTFGSAALFSAILVGFSLQLPMLHDHADLVMIGIFILGYVGIIFEQVFEFNKAGVALLMSTGLWVTYADFYDSDGTASQSVLAQLGEQLSEVSDICFFLLAASTIVEVVDAHQGFKVITNRITTTSKKELFWTIGFLTFFLSAILNNLTVTIVMVSLLRKLIPNDEDRRLFGAMVVVAANAGGVWTPIGDVTTTMLWINNQLSTIPTITELFLPSLVCLVGSLAFLVQQVEEDDSLAKSTLPEASPLSARGKLVFASGLACLLSVPVFSELTGLPPYLAMLTGLGAMWTLTDIIHMDDEEGEAMKVPAALSKLDTSGILFFLGILMSIGVLDKSGLLKQLAVLLSDNLPNLDIIATVIGLASALIDNVPLVAATMGMYDLADYGTDDRLWQLIALCAGTGGSILVIGSASGVALMGLEKVDFIWYAKKVSVGAAVGYFAGIATYLAQDAVLHGGNLLGGIMPQAAMAVDVLQQTVVM
jgi:Na+/H+ antiporter NhaD/arsenite permease-like protein/CBS domain-containing protein